MVTLKGEHIYLRALEPEDLDFVFSIENDENFWEVSNTQTPYSRFLIKQYLEHSHKDIYEAKQLRLVISTHDDIVVGLIDIFDFDFKNSRAGIGILIKKDKDRLKGFGSEALKIVIDYCDAYLGLHQLFCNISDDNNESLSLFESHGFEKIGLKKDWNNVNGSYKNEYLLQRIN